MRSGRIAAALLLVMLMVPASLLYAQTATGEVNGTLTDPSGAVTPGGPVAANPGCTAPATVKTAANWFNPCAFTVPVGSFGNLGRDAFRGPGVFNMDLSMFKSFPLPREGWNLQLRFEAFNVFNVQNWDTPTTQNSDSGLTLGNAAFGRITGLASGTNPREIQLGLRFVF